ncbi:MAG: cytochrome c [Bacteroidia bacterium]|nr:cytochrome c [Bacteroidia bacterium]MDW8057126.1 cytochrome c [Bacteroidia bacterium]
MWHKIIVVIALIGLIRAQDAVEKGKSLFNNNCAACHKLDQELVGPPLAQIGKRRTEEWFLKFVSNSQAFIQSGDAQAVAIYKKYNQQIMPPFPNLAQEDLKAIWAYLNSVSGVAPASSQPTSPKTTIYPGETSPMKAEEFNFLRHLYWILAGVAVIVALLIAVVINFASQKRASEAA